MGFLNNLFKPKYQNSNWKVRRDAVKELTDENILMDIAKNDESHHVRSEAVDNPNLTDEETLIYIIKNDKQLFKNNYLRIVEKINDKGVLSEIAETHFNDDVRLKAAIKSNNEKVLMELLLKYEDVTYTMNKDYLDALKMIADEDKLIKIAEYANNKRLRIEAISRLNNQDTLINIAAYDKNSEIREKATEKIENKELLSEKIKEKERMEIERTKQFNLDIAKTNKYKSNRHSAIVDLDDEELLKDIALNGEYQDTREEAAYKISDENILKDIATNANEKWVRRVALWNVEDQEFLADILKSDTDIVREVAAMKITDEKILFETAKHDSSIRVRDIAKDRLKELYPDSIYIIDVERVNEIDDDSELMDVINYALDSKVKLEAVKKINSQEVLINIIENFDDGDICEEAVKNPNLSDQEKIIDIAKNHDYNVVRIEAVKKVEDETALASLLENLDYFDIEKDVERIGDEKLLINLAKNAQNKYARREATMKIKDEETLIYVFENDNEEIVRSHAIKNSHFTNQSCLVDIAKNNAENNDIRRYAVEKITDKEVLLQLSHDSTFEVITNREVVGYSDHDGYEYEVTRKEWYPIRDTALSRLKELGYE
ncbi:MAG: hypothetical protein IJI98_02665 [Methanosphaera sp.]|nr:hypothetical protein [Methanosphaera sp.]